MTRRFPDISRPLQVNSLGDAFAFWLSVVAGIIAAVILGAFLALAFPMKAHAHDSWINRGGFRNPAGEWCCGDLDCKSYSRTSSTAQGWMIDGELVPYDEAMPVPPPDGQVTVCRRPDGTRRCVFGLKPGT